MFWWFFIGALGGVFGGMGMGGGTLLIPLITMILGIEQKQAQLINLVSFAVMAVFVLILHLKNKLVNIRVGVVFAVFGIVSAAFMAFVARGIDNKVLKILFGVFLIILSIVEFFKLYLACQKNAMSKKRKNTRL